VDGGAGGGVEEEGRLTGIFTLLDEFLEFRRDDAATGIDGNGDHTGGTESVEIGRFFDAVVAVGTCENLQLEITVAVLLRLRVQGIASDDDGGGVGGGAAGLGDAATGGGGEVEERSEIFGGVFFDQGKDGGDLVDVRLYRMSVGWDGVGGLGIRYVCV
jgi:hypothetical protein